MRSKNTLAACAVRIVFGIALVTLALPLPAAVASPGPDLSGLTGQVADRVAWVTGGGRGIGRAIALALGADGAHVAVSSRSESELDRVANELQALKGVRLDHTYELVALTRSSRIRFRVLSRA